MTCTDVHDICMRRSPACVLQQKCNQQRLGPPACRSPSTLCLRRRPGCVRSQLPRTAQEQPPLPAALHPHLAQRAHFRHPPDDDPLDPTLARAPPSSFFERVDRRSWQEEALKGAPCAVHPAARHGRAAHHLSTGQVQAGGHASGDGSGSCPPPALRWQHTAAAAMLTGASLPSCPPGLPGRPERGENQHHHALHV